MRARGPGEARQHCGVTCETSQFLGGAKRNLFGHCSLVAAAECSVPSFKFRFSSFVVMIVAPRRGGREAEGGGLLNRCTG